MTTAAGPLPLDVRGRRVLVTGSTGFKGAWLSEWLHQAGGEVYGLGLPPESPDALFHKLGLAHTTRQVMCDIRDVTELRRIVLDARPEIIFHLAGQALVLRSYADPLGTWQTNVDGTLNLLEVARGTGQRVTVIAATSDKVYHNREWEYAYREDDRLGGRDPYSASKAACEIAVASWRASFGSPDGVRVATVRAGNVIGGGDTSENRLVPDCYRAWQTGQAVELRHPQATRPWQHVLDCLSGYVAMAAAVDKGAMIETCNFGPAAEGTHSVESVVRALAGSHDHRPWRIVPAPGKHEARLLSLCIDRARDRLNWVPRLSFPQTIAWTNELYEAPPEAYRKEVQRQIAEFERRGPPVFGARGGP